MQNLFCFCFLTTCQSKSLPVPMVFNQISNWSSSLFFVPETLACIEKSDRKWQQNSPPQCRIATHIFSKVFSNNFFAVNLSKPPGRGGVCLFMLSCSIINSIESMHWKQPHGRGLLDIQLRKANELADWSYHIYTAGSTHLLGCMQWFVLLSACWCSLPLKHRKK